MPNSLSNQESADGSEQIHLFPLIALLFLPLLLILTATDCSAHILDVSGGRFVTFDQMIDDLKETRVVFIGELHDHPAHHQAQLQVIKALQATGRPVAIGLEMVRRESQDALDRWVVGRMDKTKFRSVFEKNWGMWPQYQEILEYARRDRIPLIGLNIPREITQQVAAQGFASLSPAQLREVPGVTCTVDPAYRSFIRRTLGAHVHEGASFENFCEAQMTWDTAMAQKLAEYLQEHPDTIVVVLAGSGHAWKYGIPEQMRRRAAIDFRVLLPEIPGRIGPKDILPEEADYLMIGLDEGPLH